MTQANDKIRVLELNGVRWINVINPNSETFAILEKQFGLHPVHLSESIQKVQHTAVEHETTYLFTVLHFPIFEFHSDKILVGQVGVFLGKDYLITVHTGQNPFINDLYALCETIPEQAGINFNKGSAYLLYALISKLLANISGMTDLVTGELDTIEDLVFGNSTSDAQRIGRLRQKIIRLRRLIGTKRQVLQDLAEQVTAFSGDSVSKYYFSNVKVVNRLWESIEEAKETIEVYKDADFTASTERTNQTLAILTLLFTLSIPMTVIGALYGMNVLLPGGLEAGSWLFFGRYTTLWLVLATSCLAAVGMYWYFRHKKWF